MAIFLVRHGETPGNARRVIQTPEVPLSDRGRGQARRVAQRLASEGIAHILSSDYARAAETAEHVQAATGAPLRHTALLRERNLGDLRGTAYADLGFDPFAPDYVPPAGESWERFHARVDLAWQETVEVAAGSPGHLAVVTHGLVCHSLFSRRLVLPAGEDLEFGIGNTSLTIVEPTPPFAISLLACTAHLDEPDDPASGPA